MNGSEEKKEAGLRQTGIAQKYLQCFLHGL